MAEQHTPEAMTRLKIKGWPTATTICKVCGEPIVYFKYWDREQTKRRRPPAYHNGHCAAIWSAEKAHIRLKRYKKQREKPRNKLKIFNELPI